MHVCGVVRLGEGAVPLGAVQKALRQQQTDHREWLKARQDYGNDDGNGGDGGDEGGDDDDGGDGSDGGLSDGSDGSNGDGGTITDYADETQKSSGDGGGSSRTPADNATVFDDAPTGRPSNTNTRTNTNNNTNTKVGKGGEGGEGGEVEENHEIAPRGKQRYEVKLAMKEAYTGRGSLVANPFLVSLAKLLLVQWVVVVVALTAFVTGLLPGILPACLTD